MYGSMKVGGTLWLWDYVADKPVEEKDMPSGSERWMASERRRAEIFKQQCGGDMEGGK